MFPAFRTYAQISPNFNHLKQQLREIRTARVSSAVSSFSSKENLPASVSGYNPKKAGRKQKFGYAKNVQFGWEIYVF